MVHVAIFTGHRGSHLYFQVQLLTVGVEKLCEGSGFQAVAMLMEMQGMTVSPLRVEATCCCKDHHAKPVQCGVSFRVWVHQPVFCLLCRAAAAMPIQACLKMVRANDCEVLETQSEELRAIIRQDADLTTLLFDLLVA